MIFLICKKIILQSFTVTSWSFRLFKLQQSKSVKEQIHRFKYPWHSLFSDLKKMLSSQIKLKKWPLSLLKLQSYLKPLQWCHLGTSFSFNSSLGCYKNPTAIPIFLMQFFFPYSNQICSYFQRSTQRKNDTPGRSDSQ